jgi:ribosomal protein L37E
MGGMEGSDGGGSGGKKKHPTTHNICFRIGRKNIRQYLQRLANHYDTILHV